MLPNGEIPNISGEDRFCYHEEQCLKLQLAAKVDTSCVVTAGQNIFRSFPNLWMRIVKRKWVHQFEFHFLWDLTI